MAENAPQYQLPDAKTLAAAGETDVLASDGTKVPFKSLYTGDNSGRQLIVFIRHFYCGSCEEYVRTLARSLPPSVLSKLTPPTTLTLIGCGAPPAIPDYITRTSCPYPIYCDPTRSLYKTLGMVSNTNMGDKKPEYISKGTVSNTLGSAWNILSSPVKAMSGGAYSQNGGEWLFEGGELKWVHRMATTADHAEVKELKEVLGMSE